MQSVSCKTLLRNMCITYNLYNITCIVLYNLYYVFIYKCANFIWYFISEAINRMAYNNAYNVRRKR